MKIRRDFVTNSSSSSFILSFKDEESIEKTLLEEFPKDITPGWSCGDGYLSQLLEEIKRKDRLTKEDIIRIFDEEEYCYSYFNSNEEYQEHRDKYQKKLDRVLKEIGDDTIIVEVEHGDGGDGEDGVLEHEVLPHLKCTRVSFSHH